MSDEQVPKSGQKRKAEEDPEEEVEMAEEAAAPAAEGEGEDVDDIEDDVRHFLFLPLGQLISIFYRFRLRFCIFFLKNWMNWL